MNKKYFLKLMKFPNEWLLWNMYPKDLADFQIKEYRKEHINSSEHTRFGAFNWWIVHAKKTEEIAKLIELSYLDSDQGMASHVRERISEKKLD